MPTIIHRARRGQSPDEPARRNTSPVAAILLALLAAFQLASLLGSPRPRPALAQETPERRVFTYFFYWYDPNDGDPQAAERQAELGLHHPPHRPPDWRSAAWFKGQLVDMQQAGIDVALAVYWGNGIFPNAEWSVGGLAALTQALDELDAEGTPHPTIGLFFDTYVLQATDLIDPARVDWLAEQLLAFFEQVPERHRATQDGRPLIWFYYSDFATHFDPDTLARLGARLEAELGARPFFAAERSWAHPTWTDDYGRRHDDRDQLMPFDAFYYWSAAGGGPRFVDEPLPVASLGPGYDDTHIVDRGDHRWDRQREGGCYYARSWRDAQKLNPHWVAIETWNEFYETSGIAESVEWGRAYIADTAAYAAAFKRGDPISLPRHCLEAAAPRRG